MTRIDPAAHRRRLLKLVDRLLGAHVLLDALSVPLKTIADNGYRAIVYRKGAVVLAMLALGVVGSGIAYILNYVVIHRSDATTASTVTYVITLVAVVSGAVVLGEHISWNQPVGAALVILGAATAQGLIRRPRFARP